MVYKDYLRYRWYMKITILALTDSDKHFAWPIQEYIKRLGKDVIMQDIKPSKKDTPQEIISYDTNQIILYLQERYKDRLKILLSKDGDALSTENIKDVILTSQLHSKDIVFVIGWPYGLDEGALERYIDKKLSFGNITMPHWLVKVVTLEQIYRSLQILQNKNYHY